MERIELDHNAATPLLPAAWEAMRAAPQGNASSVHAAGRAARQAVQEARERIAALLGASPEEVVFTSGATEANNWAVAGLARLLSPGSAIGASLLEHPCVIEPLRQLERQGRPVRWLAVEPDGVLRLDELPPLGMLCLMLANHETGAIQPVQDAVRRLPPGSYIHCDAAQAVGRMPVHFHELGVTTLAVSAYKFGGPMGIGALLVRRGTPLEPLLRGGPQQFGLRAGTEPVPLIVGMAAALEWMVQRLEEHRQRLRELRRRLWERLRAAVPPVWLNGPDIDAPHALPTTLNVSFPGCRGDVLVMALDLASVHCSTGSACSSGSLLPSPVLQAMQVGDERLRSAVRFSFSPLQTVAEIDAAAERIAAVVRRVRQPADWPAVTVR